MKFTAEPPTGPSLVERAGRRSTAELVAAREQEAEALMAAGVAVMTRTGVTRRVTVAEIVREAGLSNQAFYRHFASKDDLVAAILDDGARRLQSYLAHRMESFDEPADQVRAWIRGVFSQATDPKVAEPTRSINWNRSTLQVEADAEVRASEALVWTLLEEPLQALGSDDPSGDAYLIGKMVFAVLLEALWADEPPTGDEFTFVERFCLSALGA